MSQLIATNARVSPTLPNLIADTIKRDWKRAVPPLLLLFTLYKHFFPSKKKSKTKRNWKVEDQRNATKARLQSMVWAVRSRTLLNMLLGSSAVAYLGRRVFGLKAERTFPVFLATIWSFVYRFRVVESPKVFFRRTYFNSHIVEKSKLLATEFKPVFWLFNRHAQTVSCFAISALEWLYARTIHFEREVIPAHDHVNEVHLDWAYYEEEHDTSLPNQQHKSHEPTASGQWSTPIVILIHGLGDSKDIPYVKRFARAALKNGWKVCCYSWWNFNLADSRDFKLLVDHVHAKYPNSPIIGKAWSAGGYILAQYLEKAGGDTPLVAAISNSGCLDFVQACYDVTHNENPTYKFFLLAQAHKCISRHLQNDKRITDRSKFDNLILEELDPMNLYNRFLTMLPEAIPDETGENYNADGFISSDPELSILERTKTAAHYIAPAINGVHRIKITTLFLQAEDDPIVSSEHVDWNKVESNRNIIVAHTKRGGHVGWHQGLFPFGSTWSDDVSVQFISSILETHSQTQFIVELVRQAMSTANFYARPSFSADSSSPGFSARSMARIISASDLASMGTNPGERFVG